MVGHKGRRVPDLEGENTGPTSPACQTAEATCDLSAHALGLDTHSVTLLCGRHGRDFSPACFHAGLVFLAHSTWRV